jgi:hypothetical protein
MPRRYPPPPADALAEVTRLAAAPLLPHDRTAFLIALEELLRSEPQPVEAAAVLGHCRALLRSGIYRRRDWLGAGAASQNVRGPYARALRSGCHGRRQH